MPYELARVIADIACSRCSLHTSRIIEQPLRILARQPRRYGVGPRFGFDESYDGCRMIFVGKRPAPFCDQSPPSLGSRFSASLGHSPS
jgi:hypothetical protein